MSNFGMRDFAVMVSDWLVAIGDTLAAIGTHPLFPALSVFGATLLGGLITWACSWWYYRQSGDELRHEADQLHKAVSLVLSYLENRAANVTVQRDSNGRVIGLIVSAVGKPAGVTATAHAGSVTATLADKVE